MAFSSFRRSIAEMTSTLTSSSSSSTTTPKTTSTTTATTNNANQEDVERLACIRIARHLGDFPFLSKTNFITNIQDLSTRRFPGEFWWSLDYNLDFLHQCWYEGFLTMSDRISSSRDVLLPKLHVARCVVDFVNVRKPQKSCIKRAKKMGYVLTVNKAFADVCKGIQEQHGFNWFFPKLVKTFTDSNSTLPTNDKTHIVSFELWTKDGELIAGEVGVVCGACYTSYSGFMREDGSGTIQMFAMVQLLRQCGFRLWDLGMGLTYKFETYGGIDVPRETFLTRFRAVRDEVKPLANLLEWIKTTKQIVAYDLLASLLPVSNSNNNNNKEKVKSKKQKQDGQQQQQQQQQQQMDDDDDEDHSDT
jgi:Leu/Phe-tRNA-protein transferase